MLGFSRWQIFKTSAAAVLAVGTISLLLIYFIPAPPSTVTMGTGSKVPRLNTLASDTATFLRVLTLS